MSVDGNLIERLYMVNTLLMICDDMVNTLSITDHLSLNIFVVH